MRNTFSRDNFVSNIKIYYKSVFMFANILASKMKITKFDLT